MNYFEQEKPFDLLATADDRHSIDRMPWQIRERR
jgi:hypothetical protein